MKLKFIACVLLLALAFPCALTAQNAYYTVIKGDSLWKIAVKYHGRSLRNNRRKSQILNPSLIYPGDTVVIPLNDASVLSFEAACLPHRLHFSECTGFPPVGWVACIFLLPLHATILNSDCFLRHTVHPLFLNILQISPVWYKHGFPLVWRETPRASQVFWLHIPGNGIPLLFPL